MKSFAVVGLSFLFLFVSADVSHLKKELVDRHYLPPDPVDYGRSYEIPRKDHLKEEIRFVDHNEPDILVKEHHENLKHFEPLRKVDHHDVRLTTENPIKEHYEIHHIQEQRKLLHHEPRTQDFRDEREHKSSALHEDIEAVLQIERKPLQGLRNLDHPAQDPKTKIKTVHKKTKQANLSRTVGTDHIGPEKHFHDEEIAIKFTNHDHDHAQHLSNRHVANQGRSGIDELSSQHAHRNRLDEAEVHRLSKQNLRNLEANYITDEDLYIRTNGRVFKNTAETHLPLLEDPLPIYLYRSSQASRPGHAGIQRNLDFTDGYEYVRNGPARHLQKTTRYALVPEEYVTYNNARHQRVGANEDHEFVYEHEPGTRRFDSHVNDSKHKSNREPYEHESVYRTAGKRVHSTDKYERDSEDNEGYHYTKPEIDYE